MRRHPSPAGDPRCLSPDPRGDVHGFDERALPTGPRARGHRLRGEVHPPRRASRPVAGRRTAYGDLGACAGGGKLSVVRDRVRHRSARREQALVTEHVAQFQDLFEQAAIGMATLTVTGTIVRANQALAALMSCRPARPRRGRLRTPHRRQRLTSSTTRSCDITSTGRDLVTLEHPLPTLEELAAERLARLTLAPIRDSRGTGAVRVRPGAGHQRPARRRDRASGERATLPAPRGGSPRVRHLHARRRRHRGQLEPRRPADQGLRRPRDHRPVLPRLLPARGPGDRSPEDNLALALRDGAYAEEGWRVRKDGTRFWASVVISTVYDDLGTHVGFAKVTRDQSMQRQHEQDLKRGRRPTDPVPVRHRPRAPDADRGDRGLGARPSRSPTTRPAARDALFANIRSSAARAPEACHRPRHGVPGPTRHAALRVGGRLGRAAAAQGGRPGAGGRQRRQPRPRARHRPPSSAPTPSGSRRRWTT